jgi:hypothetical protein
MNKHSEEFFKQFNNFDISYILDEYTILCIIGKSVGKATNPNFDTWI